MLTSISYFKSYHFGVITQTRSITNEATFVREVNTINQAMAFLPIKTGDYSILNDCGNRRADYTTDNRITIDTVSLATPLDTAAERKALERPDAFSYKNYCTQFIRAYEFSEIDPQEILSARTKRWLNENRQDSVRKVLEEFVLICKKYSIPFQFSTEQFAKLPFADSNHAVSLYLADSDYNYNTSVATTTNYLVTWHLNRTMNFIGECLPGSGWDNEDTAVPVVLCYVGLALSILIVSYRRFSRKIFLISVVGTLVWSILIGLMTASSGSENSFAGFCLVLSGIFLVLALINMRNGGSKTITGVLLNWHIYLSPYIILLVTMIINSYYVERRRLLHNIPKEDLYMQLKYPISHWVNTHGWEIAVANLFLVTAYVALLYNRWAKKNHVMPEE